MFTLHTPRTDAIGRRYRPAGAKVNGGKRQAQPRLQRTRFVCASERSDSNRPHQQSGLSQRFMT
jgi:hypothetical protein